MKRVLLVIDVQNEYFSGKLPVSYPEDSFPNILKAMDEAAAHRIPSIIIQHTAPNPNSSTFVKDSPAWQIHPEVLSKPHLAIVEKNLPGSFTGTDLEAILQKEAIDRITICGYMTQMCCDTTARQAFHLGYPVEFLSDATGTLDIANEAGQIKAEELHRAILVTQAMRFSKVMSTADWLNKLTGSN